MHRHEVNDERQGEGAHPDRKALIGLFELLPGRAFERHDPGGTDPRGDDGEHHAGLRGVFRRVELGETRQLHELIGVEVGEGRVAEDGFKEPVNDENQEGDGKEGEHDALLQGMSVLEPVAFEGPEVEGVGHPDEDDQPPTAIVVADVRGVEAHDAPGILEDPPGDAEDGEREDQIRERGYRRAPSQNQLSLFQEGKLLAGHKDLSFSGWMTSGRRSIRRKASKSTKRSLRRPFGLKSALDDFFEFFCGQPVGVVT